MNKFLILVVLSSILSVTAQAQKIGYVDMEFVTSKMPEYQKAQSEINQFSEKWAKETGKSKGYKSPPYQYKYVPARF